MSAGGGFFSTPVVAGTVARAQQLLTRVAADRIRTTAEARLPEFQATVTPLEIATTVGTAAATVYRAAGTADGAPVHLNFHGGGYVLDVTAIDDPLCRAVAVQSGVVVVNVDYVVAPQHPFPQPTRQAYEIALWIASHAGRFGGDGSRLTVGGQSAGGGLAAAVARQALEHSGPLLGLQVLHYPPLDLTVAAGDKPSPSARPALRPWMGAVYDSVYAPDPRDRADRLVSPAAVERGDDDLSGITPAVVIAAEVDILRAEARRYADRLAAVGALVAYHEVAGADHGYDMRDDDRARDTYARIAGHIAGVWAP